jgi:hypothetical protein
MGCDCGVVMLIVLSLHPNQPGVMQVVVVVGMLLLTLLVVVVVVVDSSLSLHPNQPGVLQVDVVPVVVVVSSRQPHHPGVLQVAVLVLVFEEDVELVEEVVGLVLLLSYIFQFPQSLHSGVNLHCGTVSYFRITSLMTDRILCVPIPTRQPLSATVS